MGVYDPRQEMTVFYSVISDTSYFAKGYTKTEDLAPVAISENILTLSISQILYQLNYL